MMRAMRVAICAIRPRFSSALSGLPRSMNRAPFSAKLWIAISGWFNSWLIPALICPSALSLPACTRSACAFFSAASAS